MASFESNPGYYAIIKIVADNITNPYRYARTVHPTYARAVEGAKAWIRANVGPYKTVEIVIQELSYYGGGARQLATYDTKPLTNNNKCDV